MSEKEKIKLAERLKEAREYLGLSQDEVAAHLKVPRTAISLLEAGQRKVDSLELKKLATLYQRPISFFVGEEDGGFEAPKINEIRMLQRAAAGLKQKDVEEVLKFAEFLKARSKRSQDDE
jgi:transcriptional regulator with XRE-family HTH domain